MVYIPTQQDFSNYITGEGSSVFDEDVETPVLGGGGAPAGEATTQVQTQGTTVPAQQDVRTQYGTTGQPITPVTARPYTELLSPAQGRYREQLGQLGQTEEQFYQAAGPTRTFENIGAEQTLGGALQLGATPEQIEAARGIVKTQYGGPVELDQEAIGRLRTELSALGSETPTFTTPTGVGQLLTAQTPGLTPQEAAYEARLIRQSPQYRQAAVGVQQDVNALLSRFVTAQEEARERAQERQQQEQQIAGQARSYLTEAGEAVESDLASAIQQAEERNRQIAELSDQYFKTGDRTLLDQLQELGATQYQIQDVRYPHEVERGDEPDYQAVQQAWTPDQLNTQAQMARQYAINVRDAINKKYADVADVPTQKLGITSHGRETVKIDPEWEKANRQNYTNEEWRALQERVRAREDELNQLFGGRVAGRLTGPEGMAPGYIFTEDPTAQYGYRLAYEDLGPEATDEQRRQQELTALYNISPQYLGGPTPEEAMFKGPDPRDYMVYLEGMSPTRSNISNEEQRHVINTVNDLLDRVDRLEEAERPWEAAQIALGVEKFLEDENNILEARADELDERREKWKKAVHKARRKYRKAKKKSAWGKIARIAVGVGSLGMSEVVGAATGINPGEQLGYAAYEGIEEGNLGGAMRHGMGAAGSVALAPGLTGLAGANVADIPRLGLAAGGREVGKDLLQDIAGPGPEYPTPVLAPREELPQGKGEVGLPRKKDEDEENQ